jgi:hypothetical protein
MHFKSRLSLNYEESDIVRLKPKQSVNHPLQSDGANSFFEFLD